MDEQLFELLVKQNETTHAKIDALTEVVQAHVVKDEQVWETVYKHEGALPGLKHFIYWIGSICLGAVGAIAGWIVLEK